MNMPLGAGNQGRVLIPFFVFVRGIERERSGGSYGENQLGGENPGYHECYLERLIVKKQVPLHRREWPIEIHRSCRLVESAVREKRSRFFSRPFPFGPVTASSPRRHPCLQSSLLAWNSCSGRNRFRKSRHFQYQTASARSKKQFPPN